MNRSMTCLVALCLLLATGRAFAQDDDFESVEIRTQPVAEGIAVLFGRGGNIAVSWGPDGVLLVDDQFAPLTERIRAAVGKLDPGPIRFVLNTHWHFDHVGGNENLGEAGAVIVAHDNVRERMRVDQFIEAFDRKVPASPRAALPVVTFAEGVTFHWNGQTIRVEHIPGAHTDGDAIARFEEANVLHMGDVFFNRMYPFIDLSSGGSIDGMIRGVERGLELADGETTVIPGHGPVTDRAGLEAYRKMLVTVRDRIAKEVKAGKGVEAILEAGPTRDYDETWGGGFLKPADFTGIVARSLGAG